MNQEKWAEAVAENPAGFSRGDIETALSVLIDRARSNAERFDRLLGAVDVALEAATQATSRSTSECAIEQLQAVRRDL